MLEKGNILRCEGREYEILELVGKGSVCAAYLAICSHDGLETKCILKEFTPRESNDLDKAKARFLASGRLQNDIRQRFSLNNTTPPVSHIFEHGGTAYIDVSCFGGTTLDKASGLDLPQKMQLCLTVAKTVGYYHDYGLLCLDLKPENIFVLQNTPSDIITQLVEFIDFDSVCDIKSSRPVSFTWQWAAPEQLNPYAAEKISTMTDIFTLGELVFFLLFGRHSAQSEHRGFSKYPFEECSKEYRRYTDRPDIRALFAQLFRGTLRSSPSNRFDSIKKLVSLLETLVAELEKKDFVVPMMPSVPINFVGRESELKSLDNALQSERVMFVTGVGGIGKSTLVRQYIKMGAENYDVIAYLEFDGEICHTFADDMQLQLSTVSRQDGESLGDYFVRKLAQFRRICEGKRVLLVIDNFSGRLTKEVSRLIDCGFFTIIVTRQQPPKNSFAHMQIGAISERSDLLELISINLERQLTKEDKVCFEEMIELVQGHTLVLELIARQIAAGRLDAALALELIRKHGFSRFSDEKVSNYKDGEEIYDTLALIITALFDEGGMSRAMRLALKVLSLLDVRGLQIELIEKIVGISQDTIAELSKQGWIYSDKRVHVHPVIAQTMRDRDWSADTSDREVMGFHKKVIDVYSGMDNVQQIENVLREAQRYNNDHRRHFINALYYDMLGVYYDALIGGAYVPQYRDEDELMQQFIGAIKNAISEMQQSSDEQKTQHLIRSYLDLSSVYIRYDPKYHDEASELLEKAQKIADENEPEFSENRCYLCMVWAWFYTLAQPDTDKTKIFTDKAAKIAEKVFPTNLEIIDIIYIPTANCWYYHREYERCIKKLQEAIDICRQYDGDLPYIDKHIQLINCQLDVYFEMQDYEKCRELIGEIDSFNKAYSRQGICRGVDLHLREKVMLQY